MPRDVADVALLPLRRPDTRTVYTYWSAKCGERRMPARSDIDPVEIPRPLLGGISLIDIVQDERRYVYRLVGTRDVEALGQDPTGKPVFEVPLGPSVTKSLSGLDQVVSCREPLLEPLPFVAPGAHYETIEMILLPLSDDGCNVNKILVFSASRDIRKYADSAGL